MRMPRLILAFAAIWLIASLACTKDKIVPSPASFTVIHAMANGNGIIPMLGADTSGRYFKDLIQVYYGSSQLYSPVAGPSSLIVVPITDTNFKIFNGKLSLESGSIYSFYLSGDTAHADTMLVKDNIPSYNDSSAGARFINLSIGGKAITVNLIADSSTSNMEVPALGYQQITNFKKYDARIAVGGNYQFQIRDQATGSVLTTYTWTYSIFGSNTIVIAGSPDPSSPTPITVFSVNNSLTQ